MRNNYEYFKELGLDVTKFSKLFDIVRIVSYSMKFSNDYRARKILDYIKNQFRNCYTDLRFDMIKQDCKTNALKGPIDMINYLKTFVDIDKHIKKTTKIIWLGYPISKDIKNKVIIYYNYKNTIYLSNTRRKPNNMQSLITKSRGRF